MASRNGDSWVEGVEEVKNAVVEHFKNQFTYSLMSRSLLDNIPFNRLSDDDIAFLSVYSFSKRLKKQYEVVVVKKVQVHMVLTSISLKFVGTFYKEVCDLI